jgi:hypothetical protein
MPKRSSKHPNLTQSEPSKKATAVRGSDRGGGSGDAAVMTGRLRAERPLKLGGYRGGSQAGQVR